MNIPPGFAQVNLLFGGVGMPRGGQVAFGLDLADPPAAPTAVADVVIANWLIRIKPRMPSTLSLVGCLVKYGPNATGPAVLRPALLEGDRDIEIDAPQVTLLIRKTTALGGRANQGRMFHPGVAEGGTQSGGILTVNELVPLQTAFNNFHADFVTQGLPMVLLHNNEELTPTPITALSVETKVATQRRRLRKVGGRRRINP